MKEAMQKILDLGYDILKIDTKIKYIKFCKGWPDAQPEIILCEDHRFDKDVNDWLIFSYVDNSYTDWFGQPVDEPLAIGRKMMALIGDMCDKIDWEELKKEEEWPTLK